MIRRFVCVLAAGLFALCLSACSSSTGASLKQRPTIPPREIYIPVPKYPAEALKNKIEGSATVKILISRDGRPVKVVLVDVQGPDAFGEAAVEAAKKGVFVPAWRGNDPVDVWADKQFHFRMEAPTIAQ